jgi:hypothetical protein
MVVLVFLSKTSLLHINYHIRPRVVGPNIMVGGLVNAFEGVMSSSKVEVMPTESRLEGGE